MSAATTTTATEFPQELFAQLETMLLDTTVPETDFAALVDQTHAYEDREFWYNILLQTGVYSKQSSEPVLINKIKLLLDAGANPNTQIPMEDQDQDGSDDFSPLMKAVCDCNEPLIKLLLSYGANITDQIREEVEFLKNDEEFNYTKHKNTKWIDMVINKYEKTNQFRENFVPDPNLESESEADTAMEVEETVEQITTGWIIELRDEMRKLHGDLENTKAILAETNQTLETVRQDLASLRSMVFFQSQQEPARRRPPVVVGSDSDTESESEYSVVRSSDSDEE